MEEQKTKSFSAGFSDINALHSSFQSFKVGLIATQLSVWTEEGAVFFFAVLLLNMALMKSLLSPKWHQSRTKNIILQLVHFDQIKDKSSHKQTFKECVCYLCSAA